MLALHRQIDRIRAESELRAFDLVRVAVNGTADGQREFIEERRKRIAAPEEPMVKIATKADLEAFIAKSNAKALGR